MTPARQNLVQKYWDAEILPYVVRAFVRFVGFFCVAATAYGIYLVVTNRMGALLTVLGVVLAVALPALLFVLVRFVPDIATLLSSIESSTRHQQAERLSLKPFPFIFIAFFLLRTVGLILLIVPPIAVFLSGPLRDMAFRLTPAIGNLPIGGGWTTRLILGGVVVCLTSWFVAALVVLVSDLLRLILRIGLNFSRLEPEGGPRVSPIQIPHLRAIRLAAWIAAGAVVLSSLFIHERSYEHFGRRYQPQGAVALFVVGAVLARAAACAGTWSALMFAAKIIVTTGVLVELCQLLEICARSTKRLRQERSEHFVALRRFGRSHVLYAVGFFIAYLLFVSSVVPDIRSFVVELGIRNLTSDELTLLFLGWSLATAMVGVLLLLTLGTLGLTLPTVESRLAPLGEDRSTIRYLGVEFAERSARALCWAGVAAIVVSGLFTAMGPLMVTPDWMMKRVGGQIMFFSGAMLILTALAAYFYYMFAAAFPDLLRCLLEIDSHCRAGFARLLQSPRSQADALSVRGSEVSSP